MVSHPVSPKFWTPRQGVACLVFSAGAVITISILWLGFRGRMKALDVLRACAERGEEPPASVMETLATVSGRTHPATGVTATPGTRGGHLAHAATNAVFAAGLAGLAWWRISAFGQTDAGVGIALLLAALFFTPLSLSCRERFRVLPVARV